MKYKKQSKEEVLKNIEKYYMLQKVDVFGRIKLPVEVREYFDIHRLDKLKIEVENGKIIIVKDLELWFFFTRLVNMIIARKGWI